MMPSQEEIAHQQTLLATHRQNLAHYLRQQATFGTAYAPPAVMHGVAEARASISRIKQILRQWQVPVEDHPDDGDSRPEPAAITSEPVDRVKLRQILADRFNEEELRDLAFEMGIDYESLGGAGKSGRARELIAYVERHQRFDELVGHVRRLRPGAL